MVFEWVNLAYLKCSRQYTEVPELKPPISNLRWSESQVKGIGYNLTVLNAVQGPKRPNTMYRTDRCLTEVMPVSSHRETQPRGIIWIKKLHLDSDELYPETGV